MISYEFRDNNIFVISFEDKISLDDVLHYIKEFETYDYLPSDLKLLYDFKKSNFIFNSEKFQIISERSDEATNKYKSIKTAFLVNNPLLTAYSFIFIGIGENNNNQKKVFSTEEASVKWLLHEA